MIIVILPAVAIGVQLIQEARILYETFAEVERGADIAEGFNSFLPNLITDLPDIGQYVRQGLNWLVQNLGALFANIVQAAINIFIFLIALYYLLKDGDKLKAIVVSISPLQNVHDETIVQKMTAAINAVVKGSLAVALAQGVLTGIGLALFGVANATLLGSIASITALIPGIGTAIVLVPAVVVLYISGEAGAAAGLAAWGIVIVGLADNILRPALVMQGTALHPFLVLLSIVGGVSFLGPIGFLLGPLLLTLFAALIEMYPEISKEHAIK